MPRRKAKRTTKKARTKKLVDGGWVPAIERIAESAGGAIGTIAKTVSGLTHLINTEQKYLDTVLYSQAVNQTGRVELLTAMAQGLTDITRMGNSILAQDIHIKMNFFAGASTQNFVRAMLVVDKECDGVAPAIANILTNVTPTSFLNKDFSKRFVILKNVTFFLSGNVATNGDSMHTIEWHEPLNFHILFDGTTGAIGSCKENHVFLVYFSDITPMGGEPGVSWESRLNYTDN